MLDRSRRCGVERLSEREKEEIVRLSAMGLPSRLIGQQIGRHHRTVWGHLQRLRRPAPVEPIRSPLRLSLREREEISRGWRRRVAAFDRATVGSVTVDDLAGGHTRTVARAVIGRAGGSSCARRARRPKVAKLAACRTVAERWSRRSSSCVGHRSRSRVGWWTSSPTIRRCACRTRRSICRCSCSPAARYARN